MWGQRVGGVEVLNSSGGISQVGNWFPGPISFRPTFPVNEILQALAFVVQVNNPFDFIFLFAILHNIGGAWGSHRLTWQVFAIWLYAGDVNDGVNAHRVGKTQFDGIGPDQLCDGIGAKPSLQQLPRGARETEVISGKPDLISNGICWSV